MANIVTNKPKFSVAVRSEAYQKLINETLGDKEVARQFIADISTVVSQNPSLQNCDAGSILSAGLVAQSLKLPLSSSLGFAYVVPYGSRATFQVGYKGLIQLAQRTNQFERLGVRVVHKGEYAGQDEFGEDLFNFSHDYDNNEVVGYFAYMKLTTGFKKTMYWTKEQCEKHAKKYSKSYRNGKGTDLWSDQFDLMAQKTVLKSLLNRYAPLSIELQKAVLADQAVVRADGTYDYVDNEKDVEEVKTNVANTIPELEEQKASVLNNNEEEDALQDLFNVGLDDGE